MDIVIIEILPEDKISNFLQLDDELKKEKIILNEIFKKNQYIFYIIQKEIFINVSYDLLNNLNEKYFYHSYNTESGSSGAPILRH